MVALNQTVTIVNKGGKIVSTSKHLVNVFTEAKSAYNERKAEIKARRKSERESQVRERDTRQQLDALNLNNDSDGDGTEDGENAVSAVRGNGSKCAMKRRPIAANRPGVERGISDSFYANDLPVRDEGVTREQIQVGELTRRNTDGMQVYPAHRSRPRRASLADIDMDLAYGELPSPLPESRMHDEIELRSKMVYLQRVLDEGNCIQHSVTTMIDNLQKNPEALAAVALTLAEISNLAAKMGPSVLATMKGSFPAIVALLASPQFAIAAGVGVGVTIIALGGYKIIKKIRSKNEERLLEGGLDMEHDETDGPECAADQLRELDRIEKWRRGIADAGAESLATSVEGEFVTPVATRTLIEEGKLTEADFKPPAHDGSSARKARKKAKSEVSSRSKKSRGGGDLAKARAKKESSLLRSLFKRQTS